ncbi:hypothetical protein KXQ82_17100 [Mucilaginibacter sp. HMF5004]|uniref:hypothetical protein n=1 Tax=Mucilaginibacter rivuli TaxID=2857527 RepID=UPI001C5D687B|nr:hypothetical protein [Mucilaginibacter rivuli]MBW4891448.1 hypothetical protein [Mucilaginibacter rivuli]
MKSIKLLVTAAMVFAALSLGFNKANAQTTVPATLTTWSGSMPYWAQNTIWWVTLHNNTTNEDYYYQVYPYQLNYDGSYHLGNITTGTYTVTVNYYNYNIYYDNFDWYINDQSREGLNMWAQTDYTLTDNVVVSDDTFYPNNYGLSIYIWAM